ncbi:MAG: hypothetical protein D6743_15690 [Calditrichaeota bacterium]|nr:MAG: hypothetical protein D6743_15690 [Calditrichota bacterium]
MVLFSLPVLLLFNLASEYPVDGYKYTGIRRLERLRLRLLGKLKGRNVPVEGGRKSIKDIKLHLTQIPDTLLSELPEPDAELQNQIEHLFAERNKSYSLALLDITPGRPIRFAALRPHQQYQPGSVGKLAIAAGLFTELQRLFPDSVELRRKLLRERMITADDWIVSDHHGVPLFNLEDHSVAFRPIRIGDVFSFYEWVDHMLSASSNAAASTVWKECILMRAFGKNYPPTKQEEQAYFEKTPRSELQKIALSVVNDPLRKIGIAEQDWKLGSFFTHTGKRRIPPAGSHASPAGLMTFLVRLEQGKVVDEWSSLELKRLIYMTERRIRYASSPRLRKSAVYFKSGSLYKCKREPNFRCGKYRGNVMNYMNSVAIVEKPDGRVYLVALMSNVLRINSAVEHQTLATYIDKILSK